VTIDEVADSFAYYLVDTLMRAYLELVMMTGGGSNGDLDHLVLGRGLKTAQRVHARNSLAQQTIGCLSASAGGGSRTEYTTLHPKVKGWHRC